MGKSTKKTGVGTMMKGKKEAIDSIVDGYYKLGYPKEEIEKIKANLFANLDDFENNQENEEPEDDIVENILDRYVELGYSSEQIEEIYEDLHAKRLAKRENLINKTLDEIVEKCVSVEDAEVEGYKGKKIKIALPEVVGLEGKKGFEGKTYEFFISNTKITKEEFESNPRLVEKSLSKENVGDLFGDFRKYMNARGVKGIDPEIPMRGYKYALESCIKCLDAEISWHLPEVVEYLERIRKKRGSGLSSLDEHYFLSDGNGSIWFLSYDAAGFDNSYYFRNSAYLFLKLS